MYLHYSSAHSLNTKPGIHVSSVYSALAASEHKVGLYPSSDASERRRKGLREKVAVGVRLISILPLLSSFHPCIDLTCHISLLDLMDLSSPVLQKIRETRERLDDQARAQAQADVRALTVYLNSHSGPHDLSLSLSLSLGRAFDLT